MPDPSEDKPGDDDGSEARDMLERADESIYSDGDMALVLDLLTSAERMAKRGERGRPLDKLEQQARDAAQDNPAQLAIIDACMEKYRAL